MGEIVCLNKNYIFLLLIALISIGIFQYKKINDLTNTENFDELRRQLLYYKTQTEKCPKVTECPQIKCPKVTECPQVKCNNDNNESKTVIIKSDTITRDNDIKMVDPVREYDYKKSYDPLEDPTQRVDRHNIYPVHVKQYVDIPTRGYPDNFRQMGILVLDGSGNESNKILRLFGRQQFPRSNKFEYYTAINSGNDQVKIPLDVRRNQELYDDDTVTIAELGNSVYKVKIHRYDSPKYYPDIY